MLTIFNFLMISMIYIDYKRYKTVFTPFVLISSVYLILIDLNNLIIHDLYGFNLVTATSLMRLLILFILIFIVSFLFSIFYCYIKKSKAYKIEDSISFKTVSIVFIVGFLAYSISLLKDISAYGFGNIKGKESGLLAHLAELTFLFLPLLIKKARGGVNRFLAYLATIIVFVFAFMYGGKYTILLNLLYLIISLNLNKDIKFKKIIKISILFILFGVIVFCVIYGFLPSITNKQAGGLYDNLAFAIRHFFYYLLSPIIANNYTLTHTLDGGTNILFAVIINCFKALVGDGNYVLSIFEPKFPYAPGANTNVSGLLGETVYCLGGFNALLYLLGLFIVIYIIYSLFMLRGYYKLTISYLFAVLLFSFFANFFTLSGVVLPLGFLFLVESYLQGFRRSKYAKKTSVNYSKLERRR